MDTENISQLAPEDLIVGKQYTLTVDCKYIDKIFPKGTKVVFDGYRPFSTHVKKRNEVKVAWFVFPDDTPGRTRCLMKSEIMID